SSSTRSRGPTSATATSTRRSCTRTCPRRRGRRAPTSRTSGCGRASRTSSTASRTTTWPPGRSRTARSRRSCWLPSAGDPELALHACGGVRVALVGVGPPLELDLPGLLAGEGDGRGLVQAGADQVEVVDRRLVFDLDQVRPGLQRLDVLASLLELDRERGADLARQLRRSCKGTRRPQQC